VGTELVNESSIFTGYGPRIFPRPRAELQKLYEAWGGKGKITRFAWDWSRQSLKAVRNLENAERACVSWRPPRKPPTRICDLSPISRCEIALCMSNQGLPLLADLRRRQDGPHRHPRLLGPD